MNENVLKGIAEHLKPVIYNEDNYIVQEGKPLGKMLFITQGIAWTYTTNGSVGTICDSKWLERGSFCGEELLNGAFKSPFLPDIPISTRTVISQEQVEAFAIRASDLKSVVVKFWWYFSKKVTCVSQLKQWEHLAASSIQATWRRHHCAKARGRRLMCCGKNCFKICCG
jgi:cyclic nucleotide gated channel